MNTPSTCLMLAVTVLSVPITASAKSPESADPWLVLNRITHKRSYTVETRDRKCIWGTISLVTTDRLTATVYPLNRPPDIVTLARADVLRVALGRLVYYSGRSSWSDVSSIRAEGRDWLKIVTNGRQTYKVTLPYTVSDDGITVHTSGKPTKISKSEIAQVYYIVAKPLTANGEYLAEELGPMIIFDPDFYLYGLHLEQYVAVLLYDADHPEDNSPSQCSPR
jgi:hypothetical protein